MIVLIQNIFHPHYTIKNLAIMQHELLICVIELKEFFYGILPECASHFRKDFFSLDLKKSTYSTHIFYTVDFLTIHLNWLYSKMHYSLQFESNNNQYTIHILT